MTQTQFMTQTLEEKIAEIRDAARQETKLLDTYFNGYMNGSKAMAWATLDVIKELQQKNDTLQEGLNQLKDLREKTLDKAIELAICNYNIKLQEKVDIQVEQKTLFRPIIPSSFITKKDGL